MLKTKLRGYDNVEVKWVAGAIPTAIFYDNEGHELTREALSDFDFDAFTAFLKEHGVTLVPHVEPYKEAHSVFEWGGHRYELYTTANPHPAAVEFTASKEHPTLGKGYVLTISTKSELDQVAQWLVSEKVVRVKLGASDEEVEGEWRWTEGPEKHILFWNKGEGVDGTFAQWIQFEPNDANSMEDCAELYLPESGAGFNDGDCFDTDAFLVIEYGANAPVVPPEAKTEPSAPAPATPTQGEPEQEAQAESKQEL